MIQIRPSVVFGFRLATLALVAAATLVSVRAQKKTDSDDQKDKKIVTVLRDDDCGADAIVRVKEIAKRLGIDITVEEIIVANEEQAKALNWPGSPTVRINGLDVERKAREKTSYAMT